MIALDQPVWASLTTHHAPSAQGGALALRFPPDVSVFADVCDPTPAALAALATLVRPGEEIYLLRSAPLGLPPGLQPVLEAAAVQMVATRPLPPPPAEGLQLLGPPDAPDMVALAALTNPGPFLPRTHTMGRFLGVRRGGQLIAMAGERMRLPGFTEVSGVCTHPDARGGGLARRLSTAVAGHVQARGEVPFLHAWEHNEAAIALYTSLGFRVRRRMHVAVLRWASAPARG